MEIVSDHLMAIAGRRIGSQMMIGVRSERGPEVTDASVSAGRGCMKATKGRVRPATRVVLGRQIDAGSVLIA